MAKRLVRGMRLRLRWSGGRFSVGKSTNISLLPFPLRPDGTSLNPIHIRLEYQRDGQHAHVLVTKGETPYPGGRAHAFHRIQHGFPSRYVHRRRSERPLAPSAGAAAHSRLQGGQAVFLHQPPVPAHRPHAGQGHEQRLPGDRDCPRDHQPQRRAHLRGHRPGLQGVQRLL